MLFRMYIFICSLIIKRASTFCQFDIFCCALHSSVHSTPLFICWGLVLCTVYSVPDFCVQNSGYRLDVDIVIIIEPPPVSLLCKKCSPIISDWLKVSLQLGRGNKKAGLTVPTRGPRQRIQEGWISGTNLGSQDERRKRRATSKEGSGDNVQQQRGYTMVLW